MSRARRSVIWRRSGSSQKRSCGLALQRGRVPVRGSVPKHHLAATNRVMTRMALRDRSSYKTTDDFRTPTQTTQHNARKMRHLHRRCMVVDAVAQPELVIIGAAECVHVAAVAQRERVMLACACHVDALSDPSPACHVDALSDPPTPRSPCAFRSDNVNQRL